MSAIRAHGGDRGTRRVYGTERYHQAIPTSTTGAIGELLVSVDLLRKGYEVFRALSPACSCDLIVAKGGALLRIEVRTGQYRADHVNFNYRH